MGKRSLSQKQGFTLIELLAVVAILWILVLLWSQISFNKATDKEKMDRFSEGISNMLRSEVLNNVTGKSIYVSGNAVYPDTTRIVMDASGWIVVRYYSGATLLGTGQSFVPNYYGDAGYSISDINIGGTSYSGATLDLRRWQDSLLTPSGTWVTIKVRFHGERRDVVFDRRTNRIEIQ